jgi:hypothetical protein
MYSSMSLASESREAAASSSLTTQVTSATSTAASAGQGATTSPVVPETTAWVDRPSSTGQAQQNGGISTTRAVRQKALLSITVVLALSSIFCGVYPEISM